MSVLRPALVVSLALAATGAAADGPVPPSRARPKPAPRSFTNDDLDRYREERDTAKASPAPPPAGSESAPAAPGGEESAGQDTRAARFEELRQDLTVAEGARDETRARLRKIESLLNPMSAEFEVDPNVILGLQAELRSVRAQIEEQESAVTRARAALEAFEDEARRAGVRLPARDN